MWSQSRRDLIVPIRDRRQSRRILTKRNVLGTFGVAILAFAAITIRSELQHPSGTYGRLFGEQVTTDAPAAVHPVAVVTEGSVPDQTAADPMLVSTGAREQILGVNPQPAAAPAYVPEPASIAPASIAAPANGVHARVAIVSGAEGVALVQKDGDRPVLSGGIFKHP
ncbi:MAG TPA: hypothetical protein VN605_01645 [Thermoanaerobaculia bacterium]|nr:hypothetical protein [Thermoanaerobaculia bacterium]